MLELSPDLAESLNGLGTALQMRGDDEAVSCFRRG